MKKFATQFTARYEENQRYRGSHLAALVVLSKWGNLRFTYEDEWKMFPLNEAVFMDRVIDFLIGLFHLFLNDLKESIDSFNNRIIWRFGRQWPHARGCLPIPIISVIPWTKNIIKGKLRPPNKGIILSREERSCHQARRS